MRSVATHSETIPRRTLRFSTLDDALAEADRLAGAERDGRLVQTGAWPLGQMLGHLTTWADFAFDGYPAVVHAPMPVRAIFRLLRPILLRRPMMAGVKIRGTPGGTVGLEPVATAEALPRFHAAMERLRANAPAAPNPLFGRMTHEQWILLNLRHAELHFGFLHDRPQPPPGVASAS